MEHGEQGAHAERRGGLAGAGREGVGTAGVLAVGEVGLIEDVYVAEAHRGRGIGRTLVSRALEICARSLFKHVLLEVWPQNKAAVELYQKYGFRKIAESVAYGV